MTTMATLTTVAPVNEEWPLAVRITVPIVSVLAFIVTQVILYFVEDPGYAKARLNERDAEYAAPTHEGFSDGTASDLETHTPQQGGGLTKSSSTTCHMVSRETARQQFPSKRRTQSESDMEPIAPNKLSETQAHLQGMLRLNHPRTRLISTSSTGTSEEGGGHATFALSFGRKKRSRSRSTSEMHGPAGSPGPAAHDCSGVGLVDANQLTISSIKEENEFGSKDQETKC